MRNDPPRSQGVPILQKDRDATLSYDNLVEIEKRIASPNIVIFRGRPQPGMCVLYEGRQHLTKYIRPKFVCHSCLNQFGCRYKGQRDTVEHLANSDEGFAVLTVPQNLKRLLELIGKRLSLVIIDDVSLAQVVLPEKKLEKASVRIALSYLEPYPNLSTVSKMLLTLDEDPKSFIKHISLIRKAYGEELDQVRIRIEEEFDSGTDLPDLNYLSDLENADMVVINDPVDEANVRIYTDLTKKLKKCQVRYLNATPSQADCEAMKWLGLYDESAESSKHRKNWIVLQLVGARYTRQSLKESTVLLKNIRYTVSVVEKQLAFIDQPLLFMTDGRAWDYRFSQFFTEEYPQLQVKPIRFFSDESYGTNDYRNYSFCLIAGAPNKPPSAFCHPCYDELRRPEEEVERDFASTREKRQQGNNSGKNVFSLPSYPVPREVTETESRSACIQMIGRNLRDGNDEDQVKIAIVITDIPLADDTGHIPENGSRVEQFNSIGKLKVRLHALVKEALEPQVMDEIFRQVDARLAQGETVGLDQARKEYGKITGVSERDIRKELSARYDPCQTVNHQTKSTTVLKKRPQLSPVTPFEGIVAYCAQYSLKGKQNNGFQIQKYDCPTNRFEIKAINVPKIKNKGQFVKVLPIIYTIGRDVKKTKILAPFPH